MNIKKMFTTLSAMVVAVTMMLPSASVLGATYSAELEGAYNWAYEKGVTTMPSIDNANMYGAITRAEMAKMLSVYAVEVLGLSADEARACSFTDIDSVKGDLHDYIIKSCKLGIMGQGITAFRPYDTLSRAEFGTALSRVLWGSKYDGATPYYVNHLNALKAAGIMNQIANAESTKEVRGYVMLMLQRSEALAEGGSSSADCDDPVVKVACSMDTDACPAACKNAENEENTVVKAGDLQVRAQAAAGRKIIISTSEEVVSDLDTLVFKTSEEVSITKITLERYGYSEASNLSGVRLEDGEGNIIAEERSVNDKDRVTLALKKEYRAVDGTLNATIVVRTNTGAAGGTMGFKVVDVASSAENVDLGDYTPYEYDMVNYGGTSVTLSAKGNAKDYNYEEGESYEIARFKVKAANSAITVKGFTLTNTGLAAALDLEEYFDEATVVVNDEEIKANVSVNKDSQLVVSFNEIELAAKESATFIVSVSLQDFDAYNSVAQYGIANPADFSALEKKTGSRVTVTGDVLPTLTNWVVHNFKGGKMTLTNKKLGNLDAAAGSEGVVVAEGEIKIAEPVKISQFTISAGSFTGIETLTLVIAGEEYDSTRNSAKTGFVFKSVVIEESGKVQFKADLNDEAEGSFQLTPSFGKDQLVGAKYENVKNQYVATGEVVGSIAFSKVTIQAGKAALKNNLSKSVEYLLDETSTKTVFDGTYTAKKADVRLNEFWIAGSNTTNLSGYDLTFYVYLDGKLVGDTQGFGSGTSEIFKEVTVKAGESISVEVKAEVAAYGTYTGDYSEFVLYLKGTDENDNPQGEAHKALASMRVAGAGSTTVSTTASKSTLLLAKRDQTVAEFVIKPSNGAEGLRLDSFVLSGFIGTTPIDSGNVTVRVDDYEEDDVTQYTTGLEYFINEELPTAGLTVVVSVEDKTYGDVEITLDSVNGKASGKTFKKRFAKAVAFIESQQENTDNTKFTVSIDEDDDVEITDFTVYYSGTSLTGGIVGTVSDGDTFQIYGGSKSEVITQITYCIDGCAAAVNANGTGKVTVTRGDLPDFFKIGSEDIRVFKVKD